MIDVKEAMEYKSKKIDEQKEKIEELKKELCSVSRKVEDLKSELRLKRIELIMSIHNLTNKDLNRRFRLMYENKKVFGKMEIEPETDYFTAIRIYPINKDNTVSKSYLMKTLDIFKYIIWED